MSKPNPLLEKSYTFSVHIIYFCGKLQKQEKEFMLSRQLLKSGTSIGANIEEGNYAQSKPDFISKFHIALKEARESNYWLRLVQDTIPKLKAEANELMKELQQIIALLIASINTAKKTLP